MDPNESAADLYARALRFAANAHQGQKYPGTELPYLVHLTMVALEVTAATEEDPDLNPKIAIPVALLHDVLEDTSVPFRELLEAFGLDIVSGVQALSKNPTLPKEARMQDSLEAIRQRPREVWIVKMADRICNLQAPPPYWSKEKIRAYLEEAELIYHALETASPKVAARLRNKIEAYRSNV